ncbi:MAG: metallophosphoesterase [Anaerolineales bacterium]|jgi:tartrate-resistant acid phosphatase type 5
MTQTGSPQTKNPKRPGQTKPGRFHLLHSITILLVFLFMAACNGASPTSGTIGLPPTGTYTPLPALTDTPTWTVSATFTPPPTETVTPSPIPPTRFAVIGDYGANSIAEGDVANLIKSWNPDFIVTVGDNNYPAGSADTIDQAIGQYFHEYIYPYQGEFGKGATQNRFFPTLGNHDWLTDRARPYLNYFSLPNNERYYDFVWGPVHFFMLDSDSHEPDGVSKSSLQAEWLKGQMSASTSPWNLVVFHHAPYSSGLHGPTTWMRWPFQKWGASAVLSGHDHTYERLEENGIPYFVDGVGGGAVYDFTQVEAGSQVRYDADYGAMLVTADANSLTFQFITRKGKTIDTYTLTK